MSELTLADLKVGRVYRAKRPTSARTIFDVVVADRHIRWISSTGLELQYDSPSIQTGGQYRRVTVEAFLKWAKRDVTDELPENGDWAKWPIDRREGGKRMNEQIDAVVAALDNVIYWTKQATLAEIRDINQGEGRRLDDALKDFGSALRTALEHRDKARE